MKNTLFTILFLFFLLLSAQPVLAMGSVQEAIPFDVFAALTALIVALLSSPGVGLAISILIDLGKKYLPKYFPNDSAQNWRLAMVIILAVLLFVVQFIPALRGLYTVQYVDALLKSFADFAIIVIPVFVFFGDLLAKIWYQNSLKGTFLGYSHEASKPSAKKK